jgi:hypothetical protein
VLRPEEDIFGGPVHGVGDFDGDGRDDILLGNFGHSGEPEVEEDRERGRASLFYGRALATGEYEEDSANVVFDGQSTHHELGRYLGSGDFNNDGYADIVVGGPGSSEEGGSIYVVFGRHH